MEDLKEKRKQAFNSMFYSIQRIDLLIVSICGAGIYLCLEVVKFQTTKNLPVNLSIKIAGGAFLLSIIVNLLSQFFGYLTHRNDYLSYDTEIAYDEKIGKKEQKQIDKLDSKAQRFSNITEVFNYLSIILITVALLCTLYFLLSTF